ncbi:ribosomal protein S10p/S20e [Ceratobasidium sp. AG-Ba]|nr:ribosomal protein S10p/S20e [Ceratobasidium sp. AG-Ba]
MSARTGASSGSIKPDLPTRKHRASSTSSGCVPLPKLMMLSTRPHMASITAATAHAQISVSRPSSCPKRSLIIQRLGLQTPLPQWTHEYMRGRGSPGIRYSRMNIPELHRPASKRLAVLCTGDEVVGAVINAKPQSEKHDRLPTDSDFDPEQLELVQLQVAERILDGYPNKQRLLKRAVYNNLALVLVQAFYPERLETTPKREGSLRERRGLPTLPPLDIDAARAYTLSPKMDSPPESSSPVTPEDEFVRPVYVRREHVASSKWSKGISYTAYSKRTLARWSGRI